MAMEPSPNGSQTQSPGSLPDGLIAVVKADCPACSLARSVFVDLAERADLTVYTQDDPAFPTEADWVVDDTDLSIRSTTPTCPSVGVWTSTPSPPSCELKVAWRRSEPPVGTATGGRNSPA